LPLEAKRGGARLILVNLSDTPYDQFMDIIIRGNAGAVMDAIMAEFRAVSSDAVK
jgi:NAD-dependent SIR2 family protein deacetylase